MARGLLNGALVGSIGGLVCALFSVFVPMWIVSRTESASKFCWKGAGIWFYGADWGEYIEDLDKQCGKNYFGTVSTKSNYCSSGSKEVSGMCSFLDRSQAISIFAIAFCVLGILFNVIAAAPGMLRRPFGWRLTSISYSRFGSAAYAASMILLITLFTDVMTSPLFSEEVYYSLNGGDGNGKPSDVGCAFATPMDNPLHFLRSNPLTCLFPGPSFALCLFAVALLGCSAAMLLSYHLEYRKVESRFLLESNLHGSHSMTRLQELVNEPRRYSLYGALRRRLSGPWVVVYYLLPISALVSAMLFLFWTFFGEQYFLALTLDFTKHHHHHKQHQSGSDILDPVYHRVLGGEKSVLSPTLFPVRPTGQGISPLDWCGTQEQCDLLNRTAMLWTQELYQSDEVDYDRIFYFKNTISDFSPILSIKSLWEGGSWIMPVVIFVSLGVFPYFRSICWLWMFFVPMSEVWRGRILCFLDMCGKHTLSNIFMLGLIAMGQSFERKIAVPIPFLGTLTLTMKETFSTGFSTNGFILACTFGMVLGSIFVRIHSKAKQYEAEMRDSVSKPRKRNSYLTNGLLSSYDTPFADGVGGTDEVRRNTFRNARHQDWAIGEEFDIQEELLDIDSSTNSDSANTPSGTSEDDWVSIPLAYEHKTYLRKVPLYQRKFAPVPGKRHRYSVRGIILVWLGLLTSTVLLCGTLFLNTYAFKRFGLSSVIAIPEDQHYTKESIWDFATVIQKYSVDGVTGPSEHSTGGKATVNASWLTVCFITFAVVFPFLHIIAMAIAFWYPMDIYGRRTWFSIIELIQSWSALDAFLVSMVVTWHEIETVTTTMCSSSLPNMDELARIIGYPSMFTVHLYIPLFWVILMFVVMEKVMGHVVIHQFAQILSEDEGKLAAHIDEERLGRAEEDRALEGAMKILSPAQRYVTLSLFPRSIYAGTPLLLWRLGFALGLMQEAEPDP